MLYMLFIEFYNKLLQLFFMRNFFLILLFLSSHLMLSDEKLEVYIDEHHYKLFDYINKNSDLIDNENDKFLKGFEQSIKGIVDSKEISKRVMGKKIYDESSELQKERFNQKFKNTLFKSYASAFKEINYEDLKIVSHYHPKENMNNAVVRLKVNLSGRNIDFVYKMKIINEEWRIIGLIIDGIDLISIFRKQFIKLFLEGNKKINYAIDNWDLPEGANG